MKLTKSQKEMLIFALKVILKDYCSTQQDEQRYADLIKHIKGEKWNLNKNGNYLNKTSSDKLTKVLCLDLIGMC